MAVFQFGSGVVWALPTNGTVWTVPKHKVPLNVPCPICFVSIGTSCKQGGKYEKRWTKKEKYKPWYGSRKQISKLPHQERIELGKVEEVNDRLDGIGGSFLE